MYSLIRHSLAAAGLLLLAGAANAGPATVKFANPEQFADMPTEASKRDQVLIDLREHFEALAAKLPAGQAMAVEVLDLDLAGQSWPNMYSMRELRVMNGGADWPNMQLRYQITQDGKVIKSGEEAVKSMDYLYRLNRYPSGDTLRYEKQMLDSWFKTLTASR